MIMFSRRVHELKEINNAFHVLSHTWEMRTVFVDWNETKMSPFFDRMCASKMGTALPTGSRRNRHRFRFNLQQLQLVTSSIQLSTFSSTFTLLLSIKYILCALLLLTVYTYKHTVLHVLYFSLCSVLENTSQGIGMFCSKYVTMHYVIIWCNTRYLSWFNKINTNWSGETLWLVWI